MFGCSSLRELRGALGDARLCRVGGTPPRDEPLRSLFDLGRFSALGLVENHSQVPPSACGRGQGVGWRNAPRSRCTEYRRKAVFSLCEAFCVSGGTL